MNLSSASLFSMFVYGDHAIGGSGPYGSTIIGSQIEGNFSALAFYIPSTNEVVVAYRGTDDPFGDGLSGWPLGIGQYDWAGTQANLAFAFYNDLLIDIADPLHPAHVASAASVSFTGHSLGGGLAGLVSSINEKPAFVFDSMPFVESANKLYADATGLNAASYAYWSALAYPDGVAQPPSFAQIQSASMAGEVLAPLRWGTSIQRDEGWIEFSGADALAIQQHELEGGTVAGDINLHSMGLLAIALHGGLQQSPDLNVGGDAVYKYFFDETFAGDLGFADPVALQDALAYSIDDDVVALDSLFSDMAIIGNMLRTGPGAYADALARLSIAHAADIANGNDTLRLGLIEVISGTANIALGGVLDPSSLISDFIEHSSAAFGGAVFSAPTSGYANLAVEQSGYGGEAHLAAGGTLYFGSPYDDDIYGSASADFIVSLGSDSQFSDTIRGGGGNDTIYGSAGSDTIYGGDGINWINGGDGTDRLIDNNAWSDFEITLSSGQYHLELRNPGADPLIHILTNVELFRLGGVDFDVSSILNFAPSGSKFETGTGERQEGMVQADAAVGTLIGIDADSQDTRTWTLTAASQEHFYLESGVVYAKHSMDFDFEEFRSLVSNDLPVLSNGVADPAWWLGRDAFKHSPYVVQVILSDSYGATALTNLILDIQDVNEAPEDLNITVGGAPASSLSIAEALAVGTLLATAHASDPEGDTISWSLVGDDSASFAIDPVTGEIFLNGPIDFETKPHLQIGVRADDQVGHTTYLMIAIHLQDMHNIVNGTSAGNTFVATAESEVFNGFGGTDTVSYVNSASGVTASLMANATGVGGAAQGDTFNSIERLRGSSFADDLSGDNLVNTIWGGGGVDVIHGMGGNDILYGEDDGDYLGGYDGNDTLYGGNGDDHLTGGIGNDILWGGAGVDSFYFRYINGPKNSVDVIADYVTGEDRLYLGEGYQYGGSAYRTTYGGYDGVMWDFPDGNFFVRDYVI